MISIKRFIILCTLFVGIVSCADNTNTFSDTEAIEVLKKFYTDYITEVSEGMPPSTELKLDSLQKKHCTANMLKKIPAIIENTEADPFLKAQDSNVEYIPTLKVKKDEKSTNRFIVTYYDVNYKELTEITVVMVKENNEYRIDSIE